MIDIQVIKLSDFIHDVGEDEARSRLSSFSCGGLNDEVEHYLCDGRSVIRGRRPRSCIW